MLRGQQFEKEKYVIDPNDLLVENEMLKSEMQKLQDKMKQMEKIMKDKDKVIDKQRTDLTNLRKKNFEFRSRITEMEDKARNDNNARAGSRNPRQPAARQGGAGRAEASNQHNEVNELALAMHMQRAEMREREKQLIMQTMMESVMGANGVEAEE